MKKIISLLASSALFISSIGNATACTAINLQAADGTVVAGRNMDWFTDMEWTLEVMPKGSPVLESAPANLNLQATEHSSKYAYAAVAAKILKDANPVVEGQNSNGLGLSGNFLPGFTEYETVTKEDRHYISIIDLGAYILGMFGTVAEAKAELPKYKVWFEPNEVKGLPTPPWLHLVITDRTGASIVVEFVKGHTVIHDNVSGTLTNAPTYDWHLNNARNYLNLTNMAPLPIKVNGLTATSLGGEGAGMVGIPGDYSSPSRFVKAAMFQYYATKPKTSDQANALVAHLLATVNLAKGDSIAKDGGAIVGDHTQWTTIKDLTHNKIKIADYGNLTNFIQVDLNKVWATGKPQLWVIKDMPYSPNDLTTQLMK